MNAQIQILEIVVKLLLGLINNIERTIVVMVTTYPNWDATDTANFKAQTIFRLNVAIGKLQQL